MLMDILDKIYNLNQLNLWIMLLTLLIEIIILNNH